MNTRLNKKKLKRARPFRRRVRGFTILEVMMSGSILILALAGTLSGMSTALKLHQNSQKASIALHIAESEIETLLIARRTDDRLKIGSLGPRHFDRKGDEVSSANQFELQTDVSALAIGDIKSVVVTVKWENMGTQKQLLLKSMRR